jgi:hypothetical protein
LFALTFAIKNKLRFKSRQSNPWQCSHWTSADVNAGAGRGNESLEKSICNGKNNYPNQYSFKDGAYCTNQQGGQCWCCERQNVCMAVPAYTPPVDQQAGNWGCYHWTSQDSAAGAGRGNESLERDLCNSKTNPLTNTEFSFKDNAQCYNT